jgi:hypothetical protein
MNAQNQTYYVARLITSGTFSNCFNAKWKLAFGRLINCSSHRRWTRGNKSTTSPTRSPSAEHLGHLEDESVDYVFTVPPFGSNISYSDMNLFQEAWLAR